MRATLQSLKEYQDVLLRITELDRLLSEIPPEITDLENEWKAVKDRIDELNSRKETLESKQKEQRLALEEATAKSKKFESDLHEVTNNKEYHAVLKEIDTAKKAVHSLEEEISNRQKELAEIESNVQENHSLEAESGKKFDEAMASHKESLSEYTVEREEKLRIRDKLAGEIPDRIMKKFERIASRRSGVGLSLCISAICRSCNVRVRQNIVDELRKYRKLISCESCKRILFFADGDE